MADLPSKVYILTPASAESIMRVVRSCALGMVHDDSRDRARMSANITENLLPALKLVFAESNLHDQTQLRQIAAELTVGNGTGKPLHG